MNKDKEKLEFVMDYCKEKIEYEIEHIKECKKDKTRYSIKPLYYLKEILLVLDNFEEYKKQEKKHTEWINNQLCGLHKIQNGD